MGGFSLGFAIEALVAVLLAVTIGYCVLVNRKLAQLRSDQSDLKSIVRDLHSATDQAARAIVGLRESAAEADETLGMQLDRVKVLDKQLRDSIARGDALLSRLAGMPRVNDLMRETSKPAKPARTEPREPVPSPKIQAPATTTSSRTKAPVGLGLLNAKRRAEGESKEEVAA